jgi:hypothetical protein
MEGHLEGVAFPSTQNGAAEERMLGEDLVREIGARRDRGESTRQIARELGVDRKTLRRWLRIGGWRPRQNGPRPRAIDGFVPFIDRRGPEVGWNGVVLHRELAALGFSGGYQQVQRFLKPRRLQRRWQEAATIRFETGPGEQARSTTASSRFGSGSGRRRCICLCSRWAIPAACLPMRTATSGWRR